MKLTGFQIFWIITTVEVVMAVWLRISPAIQQSGQDAWLSMLAGGLAGAAITFLVVRLSVLHPGETLAAFSQKLLGKWGGRIILLPYFTAWYILAGDVLRSFADFIHLILLDKTPVWVIMLLMTGAMIYLTYNCGIKGIARFCEIAGPVTLLTLLLSFALNMGIMDWKHILPVYWDSGWQRIMSGAYAPASFFGESFLLLSLIAHMKNPSQALSRSMLGIAVTVITVAAATVMVLTVFGPHVAAKLRFPYFMLVRSINILNFIQNVDIFVIFIWVFGVFAKICFYLFLTSSEMALCIRVKDWRKIIWFSTPVIFLIALLIPKELTIEKLQALWRWIVIPVCGIAIPLLLWIVTAAKKKAARA
ncbi:GerAB/ArcD/ProY family transporter [Paenibacillus humicola]|uniref:GerAB/ArcD/ProY family transporter n=1 Tax=Paenibacillus humicola TaxID=3110540 RepID=UPI00237C36AD|nr:endospore germination permease [Paenibacillus humicola]